MKMRDIIADGMKRDLETKENATSREIGNLYEVFQQLIKTKKFENNDFKDKEDALAVIDLAEACNMFTEDIPPNFKAAGICYNNIGNIQYKNGGYDQAAENFGLAVQAAINCLSQVKSERSRILIEKQASLGKFDPKVNPKELKEFLSKDKDWNYFKKAEAHRTYLYAMSMYKHLRYVKKNVKGDPSIKVAKTDPVLSA